MKPEYLYKFVPLANSPEENEKRLSSLSRNEIWFSIPGKMNDPYEFRGIYVDYDHLKKAGISKNEVDALQKMFEENYLLSSFTLRMADNFPMWAHYANDHKGFCVKYRVVDDKHIRRVLYSEKRPDVTESIQKAICNNEKIKDPSISPELRSYIMGLQNMFMRVLEQNYTVKYESWKHEEEYRIIAERTDKKSSIGQNVLAKDVGLQVSAIYTGCKCELSERIREIANELNVQCYQCKLNEKDYLVFAE